VALSKDRLGNVLLNPILKQISEMGFPVKNTSISYYNSYEAVFVYSGKEPLPENAVIPFEDVDLSQRLTLRTRKLNGDQDNKEENKECPEVAMASQAKSLTRSASKRSG